MTYNGEDGPVINATVTDYWVSPALATRARTGLPESPRRCKTVTTRSTTAIPATGGQRTVQTDTTYDTTTGLPTVVYDHGDITQPDQARCRLPPMHRPAPPTPTCPACPREVETDALPCAGSGVNGLTAPTSVQRPNDVVSDLRTYYDDAKFDPTWPPPPKRGDVTMTQQLSGYTDGKPVYLTKVRTVYDDFGRPTKVTDANGFTTTTTYTETNGLTSKIVVTNALNQTATSTVEPTRGLISTVEDLNHLVTESHYDALGRITGVWRPNRDRKAAATVAFAYYVSQTVPTAVTTTSTLHSASKTAVQLYDALGRPRQSQTDTPTGGRLVSDTFYDTRGWAYKTNQPFYNDASTADKALLNMVGQDETVPDQEITTYDGAGRATLVESKKLGVTQYRGRTIYGGDRTTIIPPDGATPTTTFTDAFGRTSEIDFYTEMPTVDGAAVTGGKPNKIAYRYDRRGNNDAVFDDAQVSWTSTFNLLGQVIKQVDPDSGTATLSYDPNGNLRTVIDGRTRTTTSTYDALNRRTALHAGASDTDPILSQWVYDTATPYGVGKLASSTSFDHGYAYTTSTSGYDTFGNPVDGTVTIPTRPRQRGPCGSYTFTDTYSAIDGSLTKTHYPADGNLPEENVNYGYDRFGEPTSTGGLGDYIDSTTYTPHGQVDTMKLGFGQGATSAQLSYAYDQHTQQLTETSLGRAVPGIHCHRPHRVPPRRLRPDHLHHQHSQRHGHRDTVLRLRHARAPLRRMDGQRRMRHRRWQDNEQHHRRGPGALLDQLDIHLRR